MVEISSATYFRMEDGDEFSQQHLGMERCQFKIWNAVDITYPYVLFTEWLE